MMRSCAPAHGIGERVEAEDGQIVRAEVSDVVLQDRPDLASFAGIRQAQARRGDGAGSGIAALP